MNPDPDWLVPIWRRAGVGGLMTTRSGGCSALPFDSMNLTLSGGDAAESVARNRARFAAACGAAPVFLRQVHGARVVRLGAADALQGSVVHEADASITTEAGVACTVQVADCLPVLFVAPGAVGAAHAGWRGLAAGVLEATVEALCAAADCRSGDIETWLGAAIGPRRFQVGADVLEAFGADPTGAATPRFVPERPGKWLADLPGLAADRLRAAGVGTVSGGTWCTVTDAERFFSYRRQPVTGRMAAAVWLEAVR